MGGKLIGKNNDEEDVLKWTLKDYKSHLAQLAQALEPAQSLLLFIAKHHPDGEFGERAPFALVSSAVPPGVTTMIQVEPYVRMRPAHLLLSDETATSFDMSDWTIGNVSQLGSGAPLPLETFSVKYAAEHPERLIVLQEWSHQTIDPGMRMRMLVRNCTAEHRSFRGVLWASRLAMGIRPHFSEGCRRHCARWPTRSKRARPSSST